MGLTEYKRKRSFQNTPEPTGGESGKSELLFVIQKHHASRLHYDFRLEMRGVLKSWAVPKGPSMNPADKRLAMLVEDHPYDYKDFEGIIPPGNYGAGTVIIWDQGTYEPIDPGKSKAENEKMLLQGLQAGQLKFRMKGKKLKGEFVLVRTASRGDNSWLLIKHRDKFATEDDITSKDKSVVSGKTLEQVADDTGSREWKSNRSAKSSRRSAAAAVKKSTPRSRKVISRKTREASKLEDESPTANAEEIMTRRKYPQSPFPKDIKPMLATLVDAPPEKEGWTYEVKWDGYRAISYMHDGKVEIKSRNNKDFTKKYYPIVNALKDWSVNAVVDGELVVINEKGLPDFGALQEWRSEADGELVYFLFDLLWLEGRDMMNMPLKERRKILRQIAPDSSIIRVSDNFEITGKEFFALADKMGLEGILAKHEDSIYTPDARSRDWLKIKTLRHQEAIICGFTKNENTSKKFSALLLGVYQGSELVFIGPVGTGFTAQMQAEVLAKLKPYVTKKCPFAEVPDYNKPSRFRPDPPRATVTWVKPEVVAEITYRALSSDGSLRHPSFKGIREDKDPEDIRWERATVLPDLGETEKKLVSEKVGKVGVLERKTLLNPKDETQVRKVNGHDIKFTNLSKIFWPEENISKRDMLNYYYQAAPYMLPYYKDRPQTLNRFPNGIYGKSFYQKDVTGKVPDWVAMHAYYSETDEREKNFLVIDDEASLLYVVSLGCIEMNPWSSKTKTPDNPDWCIIDLDPDKNPFEQVIQTARVTHEVLESVGVTSYCKTSGSTGLHIYIPLGGKYDYEDSKEFGRALVKVVNALLPDFTSIERLTSNRKGKIYLDFLQNRPQATVAGPYSLRPKPGAPVSMPLFWDEVKRGLKMTDFNINNVIPRLRETGDIFSGVLGEGIDISKVLKKLQADFKPGKKLKL
jgi:bifunctional non-homologous end joining protein LigD